jgi:predicted nucleotidyltransferase
LADCVRVIDVPRTADDLVLYVLMNADLGEAVGVLTEPARPIVSADDMRRSAETTDGPDWRWRVRMAECIAAHLDPTRFGVKALYLIGSAKNATAGPASDIDLLVHFAGTPSQRSDMLRWFEGWGLSLSEINYLRTGYRTAELLDVHIVTDEDIARKSSYAVKIGAVTDAARLLPMGLRPSELR